MNEAAIITNRPGRTNFVPDEVVHHGDYGTADHAEIRNLYGMLMARASREGLDKLRPHKRTLLMTRSGWAGVQRYATHWTGDNGSTWDHLLLSVQMCLNLGMSGIPVTGPDIGGFSGTCTPELFARWMEAGVFMPFYRAHTWFGAPDQEPWTFGKEVEDISRKYLELRYSMLPVVYTALWQAARYGTPMMRPMSFVYPEDPATYSLDDQFMFGDSILAAPVVEEGARNRRVYLPEGAWIDFWTRRKLAGPGSITVDSPLDHLPIYIKAGSAVPRWPVQQYVGEQVIEMTEIDVYPGTGTVTSRLYQDDGTDPAAHLSENHLLSEFVYQNNAGEISFSRVIKSGTFKDVPRRWKLKLISVDKSLKSVPVFGISGLDQEYSRASGTLDVYFETAKDFEIRLG
jgi:alpha-glucosidase